MAVSCGCLAAKAESFIAAGASGILSSQVGYDLAGPKRVLIRSEEAACLEEGTAFHITDEAGETVFEGHVKKWGSLWGSTWWIADFTPLSVEGTFKVLVKGKEKSFTSDPIIVGRDLLWKKCYKPVALEQLNARAAQARTGRGFRDCGSDIQELSSHVVLVAGLCDLLEHAAERLSGSERNEILGHIVRGTDYIAFLQDLAREQGLGDGTVVHEPRRLYLVTGDAAKAAMIFAFAARIVQKKRPEKCEEYLDRALKAYRWIEANGPVMHDEELDFFACTHGAPAGYRPPPRQWMTRDLVMMMWAAVELCKAGKHEFKERAAAYAVRIMKRQVPEIKKEGPFYGHFRTFDGSPFTEKANIHCGWGDRQGRKYNQGGHFPHYLVPFLEACRLWPDHPDADEWRKALREFAYGYFLPACGRSPFHILPTGFFQGEGLLFFSGWYHGHNGIYGHAAALALEFERFFDDSRFREIAAGNLLWIAGLNSGIAEEGRFIPCSMIYGVGHRYQGGWAGIPGTICNGFDADEQFKITPPKAATDGPNVFTDEGYIVHAGGFLSGLARLPREDEPTPAPEGWPPEVARIDYQSPADSTLQPALFYAPDSREPVPLLVGLHTWSGNFEQAASIPYARWCIERGWAFIHPDFRGPNARPEATGSDLVVQDILGAVAYARKAAHVDPRRIYLVGVSGGGYTALLMAGRAPGLWAGVSAWAPITDLAAWHQECEAKNLKYARDLVLSFGGRPGDGAGVDQQYRIRSPLAHLAKAAGLPLDINAGITDGHTGSVPVSHAIRAFNLVAAPEDRLSGEEIAFIVEKAAIPAPLRALVSDGAYGDRKPLFRRTSNNARLTLFQGGHEIVHEAALSWLAGCRKR